MAKGQKRSNREAKKPKANKKKILASTGTAPGAKPKPGGAKAESGASSASRRIRLT